MGERVQPLLPGQRDNDARGRRTLAGRSAEDSRAFFTQDNQALRLQLLRSDEEGSGED